MEKVEVMDAEIVEAKEKAGTETVEAETFSLFEDFEAFLGEELADELKESEALLKESAVKAIQVANAAVYAINKNAGAVVKVGLGIAGIKSENTVLKVGGGLLVLSQLNRLRHLKNDFNDHLERGVRVRK